MCVCVCWMEHITISFLSRGSGRKTQLRPRMWTCSSRLYPRLWIWRSTVAALPWHQARGPRMLESNNSNWFMSRISKRFANKNEKNHFYSLPLMSTFLWSIHFPLIFLWNFSQNDQIQWPVTVPFQKATVLKFHQFTRVVHGWLDSLLPILQLTYTYRSIAVLFTLLEENIGAAAHVLQPTCKRIKMAYKTIFTKRICRQFISIHNALMYYLYS